jgi:hypothetical protein
MTIAIAVARHRDAALTVERHACIAGLIVAIDAGALVHDAGSVEAGKHAVAGVVVIAVLRAHTLALAAIVVMVGRRAAVWGRDRLTAVGCLVLRVVGQVGPVRAEALRPTACEGEREQRDAWAAPREGE